jgi:hypothetical protein
VLFQGVQALFISMHRWLNRDNGANSAGVVILTGGWAVGEFWS